MSTFIMRLDTLGSGARVAVKDLIDMVGLPTTAGSRAVERTATPAETDAACLRGIRAAQARIVGKVNLSELAMFTSGVNPWFGTPVNPLDPTLVPGGSSSGSGVAVGTGDADIALGTDTGGSVRIPAACCGVTGLKTTFGRIPLDGVWPLAPSLDTVGPLAATIGWLTKAMQLLEPGFAPASTGATTIGRFITSVDPRVDPVIDAAIDAALREAGYEVVAIALPPEMELARAAFRPIFGSESHHAYGHLLETGRNGLGPGIASILESGAEVEPAAIAQAHLDAATWRTVLTALFDRVEAIALPTIPTLPTRVLDAAREPFRSSISTAYTAPFSVSGNPAVSLPVPVAGGGPPASLQLVGPWNREDLLLTTAAHIESAAGYRH